MTDRSRMLAVPLSSDAFESSEELADDRIVLEVLNGIGVIGLADQFTSYLRDQGFDVVRFTNAHRFDYPRTLVINRGDDFEQARLVAQSLGLETGAVENMPDPSLQLDVTVVLGQDYATLTSYRTIMARIR
ncbi:MAG: LytR C-terminal domain-containing protein [Candidatus Marinimicrobia bacterium]|nr:LytR C-terminal domain-containing protein [Candidatus Neomarinimicrobiota bacterium]